MNRAIASALVAFGLVQICPAALGSQAVSMTEYGPVTTFNGQPVRVFFTHNEAEILSLGVEVPAALYEVAPTDPPIDGRYDIPVDAQNPAGGMAWYCCGYEIVVDLPQAAMEMTNFREVVLNWNPQGHVPPGVYTSAHTDFHFYTSSPQERLSIGHARDAADMCPMNNPFGAEPPVVPNPQSCAQVEVTAADVPADQMPPGYANLRATEPAMGNHLLDPASHEFHGQAFTHTHIFMANAGHLSGMEPMITVDFLRGLTEPVRVPISMPAAFPQAGLYPTEYVMEFDREAGLFRVGYENWKPFPASGAMSAASLP